MYTVKREGLSLTKLWSPQLQLSSHLNVVIKECAHKCNNTLIQLVSKISKKESILR